MKKILKIIVMLFGILLVFSSIKSEAVLQANGDDGTTYNLNDWVKKVREMETLEGSMGFNETINENLTASESNGIDVHMEKNSEYGALVILAASNYGNQNKITDGNTTTGNATGVVMKINSEWVAAGSANYATNFKNAANRYKNLYTEDESSANKPGDALLETKGWYNGTTRWGWYGVSYLGGVQHSYANYAGMLRSVGGSIYSYDSFSNVHTNYGAQDGSVYTYSYYTRAAIVQGSGI